MLGLWRDRTIQEGLFALSIAIVVAGVILSFAIIHAANTIAGNKIVGEKPIQQTQEQNPPSETEGKQDTLKISADNDPVLGSENAPVTIIEFSEFRCPFAGRFARDTFPKIREDYIETGKVKFVYRDFLVHSTSQKAQEASECAHEQGKFWEYHDLLYQNQRALEVDDLKSYAEQLGLDMTKFEECLDSGKYADEVEKDTKDGRAYGVRGTPTFFINGKKFVGAQPYEKFREEIESALSR